MDNTGPAGNHNVNDIPADAVPDVDDHHSLSRHIKQEHPDSPTADSPASDMAALVASTNSHLFSNGNNIPSAAAGVNKRYRPAPAKTFQCSGFGDCRMVFSRSEHLARHTRKHTGERPFSCHCSKQFSRLDNLRQHAQTVHADKQEENEKMMKDLASLHASMTAANRAGNPRGKRGQAAAAAAAALAQGSTTVKQEIPHIPPMHPRPATSTGYQGTGPDHHNGGVVYHGATWHVRATDVDPSTSSRPSSNSHSFRDPGQSFRAPPSYSSTALSSNSNSQQLHEQHVSHSFLPFSSTFNFELPARDVRPGSSSSRPPTSGGTTSLPPLSAVVSSALSSQSPPPILQQPQQSILPIPPPSFAHARRPSTANRPGTAPASYSNSTRSSYDPGSGMVGIRTELPVPFHGRSYGAAHDMGAYQSSAVAGGYDDSPFSFHPPALADPLPTTGSSSYSNNPRKRPYSGSDDDDGPRERGDYASGDYEYGSESRPQSRRLSVMELCNDTDASPRSGALRPISSAGPYGSFGGSSSAAEPSRPDTSSGLVSFASALALGDYSPPLLARAPPTTTGSTSAGSRASASAPTGAGEGSQGFGGGISAISASRFGVSAAGSSGVHSSVGSGGSSSPSAISTPRAASSSPSLSGTSTASAHSPRSPLSAVQPTSA
ncbi:hypothetical protein JAAARDRAFT_192411 [Jaapia argillacea MUCL 33604]|uniref:C2H2-type domain-containing protein n=1 Tax=Jaapia argillacea MUCL 33604 TaxID=933084 RepID=A0A067Q902_9AGAM|nr:hypothetical protein JAAARDRAFT_192411 [Jaapia argillacea MUCL 33604]